MILQFLRDISNSRYVGINVGVMAIDRNGNSLNDILKIAAVKISDFATCHKNLLTRNDNKYHITVFNVMEWAQHKVDVDIIGSTYDQNMFEYRGIGSITKGNRVTYFVIVDSEDINTERVNAGYAKKELHVTIGFTHTDLFHMPKNVPNVYEIPKKK